MFSDYSLRIFLYLSLISIIGIILPIYGTFFKTAKDSGSSLFGNRLDKSLPIIFIFIFAISFILIVNSYDKIHVVVTFVAMILPIFLFNKFQLKNRREYLEIFSIFLIITSSYKLIWWQNSTTISLSFLNFKVIISILLLLIFYVFSSNIVSIKIQKIAVCFFSLIFAMMFFYTYFNTEFLIGHNGALLWHHVSAYVGPAELIANGIIPLVDMPLQYGAGYTWLAWGLGCSDDCWRAFNLSQHLTNIIWAFSIAAACAAVPRKFSLNLALFGVCSWACCVIILPNFPPHWLQPLGTPSTKGMRFWPLALMAVLTLLGTRFHWFTGQAWIGRYAGHLLLVIAFAWSPEAALQVLLLWAGTLQWHGIKYTPSYPTNMLKTAMEISVVVASGILILTLLFWFGYGELPSFRYYFLYLTIPWGALSVDYNGAVLLFIMVIAIGLFELTRQIRLLGVENTWVTMLYISILTAVLGFSYFVNRPHDNNILNIFVFFLPMIVCLAANSLHSGIRYLFLWCLLMPLVWSPFYTFPSNLLDASLKQHSGKPVSEIWSLAYQQQPSVNLIKDINQDNEKFRDLSFLIKTIKAREGAFTIIDSRNITDGNTGFPPWSAYRNYSTFVFLASEDRRRILKNVANRLGRNGWVILQKKWVWEQQYSTTDIIRDFESVYEKGEIIEKGGYLAVFFKFR